MSACDREVSWSNADDARLLAHFATLSPAQPIGGPGLAMPGDCDLGEIIGCIDEEEIKIAGMVFDLEAIDAAYGTGDVKASSLMDAEAALALLTFANDVDRQADRLKVAADKLRTVVEFVYGESEGRRNSAAATA